MSITNKENIDLSNELKKTMKDKSKIQNILNAKKQKVSKLNTRNVNKRLRSRDQKIKVSEEKISRKDKEIEELKKKNEVFSKIIRQKAAKEAAYRSKVWYWKRIAKRTNHFASDTENTIRKLKDKIRYVENESVKVMDRIKEISEQTLNFYKNGKYNEYVRMVSEDLLSMGLITRNVERCVRLVLEKLAKAKVGMLPKVTFAKDIFLEARGLAQIHVVTKLLDSKESPLTLYSDGNQ